MKTIAVIGTRGFPGIQGGVEKHCENIYPLMQGVKLRVYRRRPYLSSQSSMSFGDIGFVDLPSTRIKGFEAIIHTLLCVLHIAFHRPAAVHVHNIGPGMFAPLIKLLNIPVILTYHSPNYEHKKWGRVARLILKWGEGVSLRFSDRIIFVNKFQREKFGKRILEKSLYIPNGIKQVTRTRGHSFLDKHGIVPGDYVLSVGRITPEKGFEYLIEAVDSLPQVKQVVIAGASDHDSRYLGYLKKLDLNHKVVFTGFTSGEDLRQLYSHAQLYVLPSVNEGFPLVMLEAMGYGLPLLLSDIPATHLIALPENDYFPTADATALQHSLKHRLEQLDNRPVAYDLKDFDWQSIARLTQEQYKCNE